MTRLLPLLRAVLVAMLLMAGSAAAHEGHDHADQTKPWPRRGHRRALEAASGPFELVALLQKGELVIYLDRFETNAPITGGADHGRDAGRSGHRERQRRDLPARRALGAGGIARSDLHGHGG